MIINNNLSAINADRTLKARGLEIQKDMRTLSSGLRINVAADDASGLAVSEKMRSQIRGLQQATKNTENGISFIQTTEGYLSESQNIMQRIRELAVQSANGIYTASDRMLIQVEVSQLVDEVNRIASYAQFNTLNMLTGRFAQPIDNNAPTGSMWFQVGANMDQRKRVYIGTMTAVALGIESADGVKLSLSSPDKANTAIGVLDEALTTLSRQRADLGAYQNRLEFTSRGLMIAAENTIASESRIRDADMAKASVKLATDMILNQANVSMLAQANTLGQGVLRLLN